MWKARLRRSILLVSTALTIAAVAQELRRPKGERSWHGRVFGVPYDLRPPSFERLISAWWNPREERLVVPRVFGLGWDINLHRAFSMLAKDPPGRREPGRQPPAEA